MKVNWYYVHSLQFGRWSTVLFRYYLLGGNTVVPSGVLAKLCHAFLVFFIFLLWAKLSQYLLDRFSRSFHQMEGICVNFFSNSSRDVAMATNLVAKMGQNYLPLHLSLSIQNVMGYCYLIVCINSANDASISCKKISWTLVQLLDLYTFLRHGKKWHI